MSATVRLLLAGTLAVLAGCARPLPPDRLDHAGEWRAGGNQKVRI